MAEELKRQLLTLERINPSVQQRCSKFRKSNIDNLKRKSLNELVQTFKDRGMDPKEIETTRIAVEAQFIGATCLGHQNAKGRNTLYSSKRL